MNKYKRFSAFILALTLIFSSLYLTSYASDDIVTEEFVFEKRGDYLVLKQYTGSGGEVVVPETVKGIKVNAVGKEAFAEYFETTPDNLRVTKVSLPISVVSIEKSAFMDCKKLSEIEMVGVRSLGDSVFWNCIGLKKVAVSSVLEEFGANVFGKCSNVKIYCESGSWAEKYAKSNSIKTAPLYPEKIALSKTSLSLEKGSSSTLTVKSTPSDVYYKEYFFKSSGSNATVSQSGKVTAKKAGTETITCVSIYGGATATCNVKIKTPSVKFFKYSDSEFDSLKLSWEKASDAQGYRIELKKSGKWVKLTETTKLFCKVTGLAPDTTYEFRIRAYKKSGDVVYNSDWTELKAKSLAMGKVTNVIYNSNSSNNLAFSWSKVSKAVGYQVYVLNSNGKYEKAIDTKELYYTQDVSKNEITTYKIRAYTIFNGKRVYSKFNTPFTFSAKPSKVSGLKVTAKTKDSISLKWDSVKNASGYAVYTVKSGSYSLMKKVSSASAKITGLKPNTNYTFVVRAYITTTLRNTYSDYSKTVKTLTAPAVSPETSASKDLTMAFENTSKEKNIYVVSTEKVFASVDSVTGGSRAETLATAYADMFAGTKTHNYNFKKGKDSLGMTPAKLLIPEDGFSLTAADIKKAVKEKDGSGYHYNVTLNSETAKNSASPKINSHVWGKIDKAVIDEAVKDDAKLTYFYVKYSGTNISSKINASGTFDTLTISIPYTVTVKYTVGSTEASAKITGKIIKDYIITAW